MNSGVLQRRRTRRGVIICRMLEEPEGRPHPQYTTGRPWLDVVLVVCAILFCKWAFVLFVEVALPIILFFRLQWFIAVVIFVSICLAVVKVRR